MVSSPAHLGLEAGLGHHGGPLGDLHYPFLDGLQELLLRGPDVVVAACVVGDHVGLAAAGLYDVVDAGLGDYVLPEEVDADVHELHGVQGASSRLGVAGGVAAPAVEVEPAAAYDVAAGQGGDVEGSRVVAQGGVHVVEEVVVHHYPFAAEVLLGGCPVEPEGPGYPVFLHGRGGGEGGSQGSGAVDVVSASVAHAALHQGLLPGQPLVAQVGEGVVLAHDRDYGSALSFLGDDGGGHPRHAVLYGEPVFPQGVGV